MGIQELFGQHGGWREVWRALAVGMVGIGCLFAVVAIGFGLSGNAENVVVSEWLVWLLLGVTLITMGDRLRCHYENHPLARQKRGV